MRGRTSNWRRYGGIVLLGLLSLGGMTMTDPGQHLLASAQSFVRHYRALENSDVPAGFWERVAFSLILASADSPGRHDSQKQPRPSS